MSTDNHDARADEPTGEGADELEIETDGVWEEPLEERADPRHDPAFAVFSIGRPRGEPSIFLHTDALEKMVEQVAEEKRNEVGGVLLGSFYLDRGKLVTDVLDAVPAPQTQSGVSHVTFSHDTWTAIFDQTDLEAGQSIVGWYHSHPGFGVFLSKQDLFIHQYFFDNRNHVAVVIDPVRHNIGVFKWLEGSVVAADGLWIVAPKDERDQAELLASRFRYRVAHGRREPRGLLGRLRGR